MSEDDAISGFKNKKEENYFRKTPILTKSWVKAHLRIWGNEILNKKGNKEKFIKNIKSIDEDDIDDIDDYEIEALIGERAAELFAMYFAYKMESVAKRAFIHMAMDKNITLMEDDVMRALMMMDMMIDQGITLGSPLEYDFHNISQYYKHKMEEKDEREK